tara:strand:+ start:564 stop:1109 length:546 start_codon:yes stop_codon:yes gene_type:complete
MANFYDSQLKNKNYLSPIGFKFTLATKRKVDFFSNSASVPGLTLGTALQTTPLRNIDVPGDELLFDDFNLEFLVDEDLNNYMILHNWLKGLGFPESMQEFKDFTSLPSGNEDERLQYVDGTLHILNSNYRDIAMVRFKDLFPTTLSSLEFNATDDDVNYFTAQATFKYSIYNMVDPSGKDL